MRKFGILLALMALLAIAVVPGFAQDQTIAEIVVASTEAEEPEFTLLLTAVGAADPAVLEALSDPESSLTVFAPTDAAFMAALEALGIDPMTLLSDQELLTSILLYHVVEGEVLEKDVVALEDGTEVETLQGESLTVSFGEDDEVFVNEAQVVATDIIASNGVVHVIDAVILPPSVVEALSMAMDDDMDEDMEETTLGTEDDPIVLLFIPSENAQEVQAGADDLVNVLSEETGLVFEARVSTDFAAAIEAMCSGEAEMAALNTFGYILASERGCADVGVVSVRFGSTFYAGQIITTAESGIESYADLAGTTFCRPDPLSTSGWIIPSIALQANGVDLESLEVIDSGGHDGVVSAVYNGECDAGATFVDARGNIEDESPDVFEKVIVIAESAPIPNDTLSFSSEVPESMKESIVEALLAIAADEENVALLDAVYSWSGLEAADDSFFDDFREQLDAAGINIEELN